MCTVALGVNNTSAQASVMTADVPLWCTMVTAGKTVCVDSWEHMGTLYFPYDLAIQKLKSTNKILRLDM
jgi:hypothetical protein